MKVRLDSDERYPVYSIRDDIYGMEVTTSPEAVARWNAAHEAFNAAQGEMADLYDAADQAQRAREAEEKSEREAAEKAERERLARQRREEAAEREAKRAAMLSQVRDSGGIVYDAKGNPIGAIHMAGPGGAVLIDP